MSPLRRALLLLAVGACACSDSNAPEFTGIRILSGEGATDTIGAELTQAVVAELRDERGRPVPDHVLRFTAVLIDEAQPARGYTATVSRVDENAFSSFSSDRTDASGRARALVKLGLKAGTAMVIVTDPDQGIADTATFTIQPGAAVRLLAAPKDTSIYVGRTMTLRSAVVDRMGNPRSEAVVHSVVGSAVTLSGSTVSAVAHGGAVVTSTFGPWSDVATITVPPEGVIAAFTPSGLATFKTDGSEFRVLAPPTLNGITTAWAASGAEIAFDRSCCAPLQVVNLSGAVRNASTSTVWALYPAYSPDGQWLYYSRDGWRLARVRSDGTGDELVPMTTPVSDGAPSASPDGTRLVYTLIVGGGQDRLWILDLATGASTDLKTFGHQPAWSPSGNLIAYLALQENSSIKVINSDGTGARTVSPAGSSYSFGHDWSPDGQWIVVRNARQNRLEVINATSGQAILLGSTAGFHGPSWKP